MHTRCATSANTDSKTRPASELSERRAEAFPACTLARRQHKGDATYQRRCGGVAALVWLTCEVEQQQRGQAGGRQVHHAAVHTLGRLRDACPPVHCSQQLASKSTPQNG